MTNLLDAWAGKNYYIIISNYGVIEETFIYCLKLRKAHFHEEFKKSKLILN